MFLGFINAKNSNKQLLSLLYQPLPFSGKNVPYPIVEFPPEGQGGDSTFLKLSHFGGGRRSIKFFARKGG